MLAPFFGFRGLFDSFDNTAPYAQVRETQKGAILELEVPRFSAADIKVDIDAARSCLTVTGRQPQSTAEEDEDGFGQLVYASGPLSSFQRTYHFSSNHYDVTKTTWDLKNGVLQIRIPKLPPPPPPAPAPQPVTVFGGKSKSGELVARTTPEEFAALRNARWPPAFKVDDQGNAVVYKCNLPPTVTADHIDLTLRGRYLVLSVNYQRESKSENRSESQSMSYSTSFVVPEGTKPEDIHTSYADGLLTIQADKHPDPKQGVKVNVDSATASAAKK